MSVFIIYSAFTSFVFWSVGFGLKMSLSLRSVVGDLVSGYREKTPSQLKLIDAFLVAIFITGVLQFVYCALVGTFPFNSFLSGFIASVGCFVLTGKALSGSSSVFLHLFAVVSLRLHLNSNNKDQLASSPERAFADYVICNIILFVAVFSFMG